MFDELSSQLRAILQQMTWDQANAPWKLRLGDKVVLKAPRTHVIRSVFVTHSAHHRGQQMAMLRMLGHDLHSNYGPTADTGGLMQNQAPTIYAYPDLNALLNGEAAGGRKASLPGSGGKPATERPS